MIVRGKKQFDQSFSRKERNELTLRHVHDVLRWGWLWFMI